MDMVECVGKMGVVDQWRSGGRESDSYRVHRYRFDGSDNKDYSI